MLNEVLETASVAASTISTAVNTAGGIKGFIQSHPIASVAAAAGVSGAGAGVTVRATTMHSLNRELPESKKKNFFGKPKKKAETKKDEPKNEETISVEPTTSNDAAVEQSTERDSNGNPIIDASFNEEKKENTTECDSNNAETKEEPKPTSGSTKKK